MKHITLIGLLILSLTSHAQLLGGVGSGGGGTTNPNPAEPERVATVIHLYGGQALLAWLYSEQDSYFRKSEENRATSPFRKLFSEKTTIFDVLADTKVELRFSEPCYNSAKEPVDGSIYSNFEKAICMSPFTIAPKLNQYNVDIETLALVIHELSHLLGTDEEEANQIQAKAIAFLMGRRMSDFAKEGDLTMKYLLELISNVHTHSLMPEFLGTDDIRDISDSLLDLRRRIEFDHDLFFSMIPQYSIETLTANFMILYVQKYYVCANDLKSRPGMREWCQGKLDLAFSEDEDFISAKDYVLRVDRLPGDIVHPAYEKVRIRNLRNQKDLKKSMQDFSTYLETLKLELEIYEQADIDIIRN